MNKLNEEELYNIVTKSYFGNVDLKQLDGVLNCFAEDATLTIQTDNLTHHGKDKEIKRMFSDFFPAFDIIWHGDFQPIIDVQKQSIAVRFNALRLRYDGIEERATNINLFFLNEGKFSEVYIYMSDENPLR
tara:strand:+ start:316 stop:708 length:393 start_codon:yes stop_codon:yes gene_type:complete